MNNAKKLVALLLLLCLALPLVVACGNTPADTKGEGNGATDAQTGEVEDITKKLEVPEDITFDGHEFTFFVGTNVTTCPHIFEAQDNDNPVDAAIYARNLRVEEEYDVTIKEMWVQKDNVSGYGAAYSEISKAIDAGDMLYDAAVASTYDCGTLSQNGYIVDLRNYGYVNLSKAWWDQAANKQLTIYDRTYFTAGDISYIDDNFTYAITFNKELALQYQLEDLYQIVRDGKWTYDKLIAMSKQVSVQDTVTGYSDGDMYGFLGYNDTTWMSFSSIGATVAAIGEDGALGLTLYSDKNFSLITKWTEFGQSEAFVNWQMDAEAKAAGWKKVYSDQKALFFGATIDGIYKLRDTEINYGFLPWPKYDEEQASYHSGMSPNHISLFCIPKYGVATEKDIERTSILVEVLAHGSSDVIEGFYEKNLQGKSVRDEESYETLDIIFADKIFDQGFYYNIGKYRGTMSTKFKTGDTTFASFYAEMEEVAKAELEKINKLYKGLLDNQ